MHQFDLERPNDKRRTFLIWHAEGTPPVGDWTTVLWSGFAKTARSELISIPKFVEEHAESLRARYLSWIYELGETRINGKRLVDHLELTKGFSYWWITGLAQKFNVSGTSQIDNAIKALALEKLVSAYETLSIVLVTSDEDLAETLRCLCQKFKWGFSWKRSSQAKRLKPWGRKIYSSLPFPLQAFIFFVWYLFRRSLFLRKKHVPFPRFNGEICFVDIFIYLDIQAFTAGSFISNYWTLLVRKLFESEVKTNWVHNYFFQESIPTLSRAQEMIECFNKTGGGIQSHALIESHFSLAIFIQGLKYYFRTVRASLHLSQIRRYFIPTGSSVNFWPLFKEEWFKSLRGPGAMLNCLRLSLYEKAFSCIPYQKCGVYIQENQPWEMALIYAWKAAGHGMLIGAPHSTVRFWDLRYFYDTRNYVQNGKNVLPMPDMVAVNGPVAKRVYLEGGYPGTQVREVEALRFIHLADRAQTNTPIERQKKPLNILVCGDFLWSTNEKMLSWLSIAARSLPLETLYVLKPHPACPIKVSDYPSLTLEVTDAPLAELFPVCDVAFTSNITSAAVDAYCAGIPVIQILDGNAFNVSPLRGQKEVVYITNPIELAEAFRNAQKRGRVADEPYFCLDRELPRWSRLLGIS